MHAARTPTSRRDPRGKTQGVHTGISKSSPLEFATVDPAELTALPEDAARCSPGGRPVPSIVHQIWLGGWKMMYAKLLSVMSVHYLLRPERHVLLYDTVPVDGKGVEWPEWRCACLLAHCERTTVPLSIAGRGFDDEARVRQTYAKLRYASDALGRCANSQLDLLRLETMGKHGGLVLDLDVVVLRSLDAYRRCASDAVVGWGPQLSPRGGQVSSGVLIGRPGARFYASWRRRLLRGYDAGRTDFGRSCALSRWTGMAAERSVLIYPQG
mmetsp:Transcript_28865/g.96795  ORF Transcript_28865/g.96795 Transcript_28865/m.96795 type:complete len:269 (-) Transcript_28865:544-1350(-)